MFLKYLVFFFEFCLQALFSVSAKLGVSPGSERTAEALVEILDDVEESEEVERS